MRSVSEGMHFSEKINKRMVEEISLGNFRITNCQSEMDKLLKFVSNFDCDIFYK